MNADDILNNTDPEELRNIIRRLLAILDAGQRPPSTLIINQIPTSYPPVGGDYVPIAGHDPQRIVITDIGGNIITDDSLKYILASYAPGSTLSTGSVNGNSTSGVEITGLTVGEWYAIDGAGGPWHAGATPPLNGNYYIFELSTDGITFSGRIGLDAAQGYFLVLPSFAAYIEAVDGNLGRVYFQASSTSIWFRCNDVTYGDNTGTMGYALRTATVVEDQIRVNDIEYVIAKLAAAIHTATEKTTPADGDEFGIWDSTVNLLKKLSWSNIKITLKAYFDTLYGAISHTHAASTITNTPAGNISSTNVQDAINELDTEKSGELLMQDGVASPPIPLETEDGTDWLYAG